MVVAYLRGFLRPTIKHGLRTIVAENYVMETILADNKVRNLEAAIASDSSILPALKYESKRDVMRTIRRRMQRCLDIRNGKIYSAKREQEPQTRGQISLYQLYHLATKAGILESLGQPNETPVDEPTS